MSLDANGNLLGVGRSTPSLQRRINRRFLQDAGKDGRLYNPNYGYASRRWLVSEMEGLPGLKA